MKELAEVVIKLFEELPFIKRDNLNDGAKYIFWGWIIPKSKYTFN